MRVLGITGAMYSGKTTVGRMIAAKYRAVTLPLADSLKDVARQIGWTGSKDEKGRRLLQGLGSLGRDYNPMLWCEHWYVKAVKLCGGELANTLFIVDDIRFNNEAGFFSTFRNFRFIEVVASRDVRERRAANTGGVLVDHESEHGVHEDFQRFSLANNGTLEQLESDVRQICASDGMQDFLRG